MDPENYVLRNVSEHALQLRLDGRLLGTVEPDDVVKVPAELYEGHEFAETLWALVSSPPQAGRKARKTKDTAAEDSAADSSSASEE